MIGASNFFELSVAVAISLFGAQSPVALATIVGVLVEVPVMLTLVKIAKQTRKDGFHGMNKPKVAFICVHNSCRSQIAEAWENTSPPMCLKAIPPALQTKPQINQDAVRLMKEIYGIDMEQTQRSKLLDELPGMDIVVKMGCEVGCPFLPGQHVEDWGLDDPSGKSDDVFRQTIQTIHDKVLALKAAVESGEIRSL